jgi:hypothetical protein
MVHLTLAGLSEDGRRLLLVSDTGVEFTLDVDTNLRAVLRGDNHARARLGQLEIKMESVLRPRDIQARIRAGETPEAVAAAAQTTVDKIMPFAAPVLAEREHVAQVAQKCAVGSRAGGPVTLAERVSERLRDRGVDRDDVEWDSSRDDDGVWQLTLTFAAGGRQRTATWRYEPLGGSVTATNDEARWLSEEAAPGAIPTPHRAGGSGDSDVYDIDADGGVDHAVHHRALHEPIDLMAAMREHSTRGRRRRRPSPSGTPGDDRPRADALPIEDLATDVSLAPPPPAARGRNPVSAHLEEPTDSDDLVGGWREHDEGASGPGATDEDPTTDAAPRPAPARKGRPSVPSWDDIVFGTRGSGSG